MVATLEVLHGDLDLTLTLFDSALESYQCVGDSVNLATTLVGLARFLDHGDRPEIAATIFGTARRRASVVQAVDLHSLLDHLRTTLGETGFDDAVAAGEALEPADGVRYARDQILLTQTRTPCAT